MKINKKAQSLLLTVHTEIKQTMKQTNKNTLPLTSEKGEVVFYQLDESIRLEVRLENDTVWLTQAQMAELFCKDISVISRHISRIFSDNELDKDSNLQKIQVPNSDKPISIYSLDVVISVGYRVNSRQGVAFRNWATRVLKEYMLRGYSFNQHFISMQEHVDDSLATLETRDEDREQKIDILIQKEQPVADQMFSAGCVWDGYSFISNLVRSAKKRAILVDPSVNERTLQILDKRAEGVRSMIHTRFNYKLQLDLQKHEQNKCRRIIIVQLPRTVQDRYLIIDDELWLLGESLKDVGRGLCAIIKLGYSPDEILDRIW